MNNGCIPTDSMPRFKKSTPFGIVCDECNKAFIAYGTPPDKILANCPWCDSNMSKKVMAFLDEEGWVPELGFIKKALDKVDGDLNQMRGGTG